MKKPLSILLASLLMVSTIGVTVHKHYCNSTLIATSFYPLIADACDADMPMEDDSCKDDHQHYNVDSPLLQIVFNFDTAPSLEWVVVPSIELNTISRLLFTPKFYADVNPPPSEPNIYTKVQSFLL